MSCVFGVIGAHRRVGKAPVDVGTFHSKQLFRTASFQFVELDRFLAKASDLVTIPSKAEVIDDVADHNRASSRASASQVFLTAKLN
jgi:hypothetical protein